MSMTTTGFRLDPAALAALTRLRPHLPGAHARPALTPLGRPSRGFDNSLKSGRGFREALTTAQHFRRSLGHADHTARPSVPPSWVHEPRIKRLAFGKL